MKSKFLIGVDEAGRGPLAGPVAVGIVLVPSDFDWGLIAGVNDSKKLSEKNREAIFLRAKQLKKEGKLDYCVAMSSASMIDKKGIVPAITNAIQKALVSLEKRADSDKNNLWNVSAVKLDGGLKAPERYTKQKTIIKGDSKEKVIGLASIMAKVTRDKYMRRQASLAAFTPYDFATHKGYGTKAHREAIESKGISTEHRHTFCRNIKGVV